MNCGNNTYERKRINLINNIKKMHVEKPIFIPIKEFNRKSQTNKYCKCNNKTITCLCGRIIQQKLKPLQAQQSHKNEGYFNKNSIKYRNFKYSTTFKESPPMCFEINSSLL